MKEYNVTKATVAQKEYQERTSSPDFPPRSGVCWSCRRNIYENHYWVVENGQRKPATKENHKIETGISVQEAGERLVTGCPHCHRSYCD